MRRAAVLVGMLTLLSRSAAFAQGPAAPSPPDYAVIRMSIDVDRSAGAAWARVGRFCDLGAWFKIDCTITRGDGDIGSVRSIAGGRVVEVMVARTDLSYGYAQPPVAGKPYDLYHGFLEARPVSAGTSRLLYTLIYDVSLLSDQATRDADIARRRAQFEAALKAMKEIAERP
jgi:Polyketide cyclase / dehydrase and lipid transport